MLKAAIFDFDGTLFDSMFIWDTAGEVYLRSIGVEPDDDLLKALKSMSLLQSARYIRERYEIKYTVKEIMDGVNRTVEGFYFHTVKPKVGVVTFLEKMREEKIKMCIVTATERYQVEAALKRCGMDGFFTEIFTCTELACGKDKPLIYRKAVEHLKATKKNTVVFEDAYYAAKTAKSDGFLTVAVYDSHEDNQARLYAVSDCYIESFAETEHFWQFASGV